MSEGLSLENDALRKRVEELEAALDKATRPTTNYCAQCEEWSRKCASAEAKLASMVEAARWVLHVANGVSRAGHDEGPPSHDEYVASLRALEDAISDTRKPLAVKDMWWDGSIETITKDKILSHDTPVTVIVMPKEEDNG